MTNKPMKINNKNMTHYFFTSAYILLPGNFFLNFLLCFLQIISDKKIEKRLTVFSKSER